jgi:hypothetical protein
MKVMGWKLYTDSHLRPKHTTRTIQVGDSEPQTEHYMDWENKGPHEQLVGPNGEGTVWLCGCRDRDDQARLPEYSTDLMAAWDIVEKLTTTTKQWFRYEQSSITYTATFEISGAGDADFEHSAQGFSAPEAICRAALKCV